MTMLKAIELSTFIPSLKTKDFLNSAKDFFVVAIAKKKSYVHIFMQELVNLWKKIL